MRQHLKLAALAICACVALAGCKEELAAERPVAIAMTEEAVGHYCNMTILEHTGPKAQIHLKGIDHPIWFSQVRDAIAFTRLPEETQEPVAIYVNDMGRAADWDFPADDTWIDLYEAFFVIESTRTGSMGAPEAVPFGTQAAANDFAQIHGGRVLQLHQIPDDYVLGPVELGFQDS
ncbi:nitrous oxide reductase accessory protein NosL [Sulfitobacter sp. M368]|uniref:nitrous oxide reductase accessory protein NosL n=1 Tax=Sulfitobacter sp. M368 TaxID=2867021 RepID=UPI0021A2A569|nr:nitrous oxide reductase accessory protein NosL [Sulfitobacter sp. M368]UWR14241.1 nitrous oxide reductase accessory protein NosL [Sulfitobacter sp. M368]